MQDWIMVAVAAALALVALTLAVALVHVRSRTERAAAAARAEADALRARLDALERRVSSTSATRRLASETEFVITGLGGEQPAPPATPPAPGGIDRALFADLVVRETVVKAASLAHGLRRALDAETRNRIRFEMRREVKRARKQRRADLRQARREWEARQRAGLDQEGSAA